MPSDFHDDVRVAIQISSLVMFIPIGNASNVNVAVPNENVHLFRLIYLFVPFTWLQVSQLIHK
jgi:hypothetical protein